MSSKRKSPPTKLQDGGPALEDEAGPLPPTIIGGGSDGGGLTDIDESSSNNLSDLCEEETAGDLVVANSNAFYKLSDSSSAASGSGSDAEDVDTGIEDERSPPNKKQRLVCPGGPVPVPDAMLMPPSALVAMTLQHEQLRQHQEALENRRRNSSECSSPTSDMKTSIHNNNNSTLHNNNSSATHANKRTMDDVLKRLTSKMNNSTIREERRPTPATTPNAKNQ